MDDAVTIYLPPGGRGTTEVVEGARAIKLICKVHPKQLI